MLRRILVGVAVLVLVPLIAAPLWVLSLGADLPEPNDRDLDVATAPIADEANGFVHLLAAGRAARFSDDFFERVAAPVDARWLEQTVRENREALEHLERFLAAPRTVYPVFDPDDDEDGRDVANLGAMRLARLAAADARLQAARGRNEAALRAALVGIRLGGALGRVENPVLIEGMIALGVQRHSLLALDQIARDASLTPARALALVRELEAERMTTETWQRVLAGEYRFAKSALASSRDEWWLGDDATWLLGVAPRALVYRPNRTLALAAERYRRLARAFAEPCASASLPFGEERDRLVRVELLHGNWAGAVGATEALPSYDEYNQRRCAAETRISLLQAAIALRTCSATDCLGVAPRDAFTGAALQYDPNDQALFSFGSGVCDGPPPRPLWLGEDAQPGTYVR